MGKPGLQLGGAHADGISLVDRPRARLAEPRGCRTARSFPWLRCRVANSRRFIHGQDRRMGCRPRRDDLFQAFKSELGSLRFIAEDLGFITPDVCALRDQFSLPGTRVLQFAFDGSSKNPHLPTNYPSNVVAYTGTHDNNTSRGWYEQLSPVSRQQLSSYLNQSGINNPDPAHALMEAAWKSPASLAIAPLQDLLSLGSEARMNVPGSPEGNWRWRCTADMLAAAPFQWLKRLTQSSGRAAQSADGRASALMEVAS